MRRPSHPNLFLVGLHISALQQRGRAGQGRAGQGRAGQGRAGQGRAIGDYRTGYDLSATVRRTGRPFAMGCEGLKRCQPALGGPL